MYQMRFAGWDAKRPSIWRGDFKCDLKKDQYSVSLAQYFLAWTKAQVLGPNDDSKHLDICCQWKKHNTNQCSELMNCPTLLLAINKISVIAKYIY